MKYIKSYVENVDAKTGEITATASTQNEDRDGDVILNDSWDLASFKKNPLLLWSHDATQLPIGKVNNITNKNGKLEFRAQFAEEQNEFAGKVARLMRDGFINAFSVGFIPKESDERGHISKAELLEISVVNVPANQEALLSREYKSFQKDITKIESNIETKSPACKQKDESKADCMARKIPEITKERPDMKKDQVLAIANSMCSKSCDSDKGLEDMEKLLTVIDKNINEIKATLNTKARKVEVTRTANRQIKKRLLKALRVVDNSVERAILLNKKGDKI